MNTDELFIVGTMLTATTVSTSDTLDSASTTSPDRILTTGESFWIHNFDCAGTDFPTRENVTMTQPIDTDVDDVAPDEPIAIPVVKRVKFRLSKPHWQEIF